jgi:serine protease Do
VIGINTAIATANGGYQGVGFALPVNTMAKVYNQIIKHGRVTRGSIGVGWNKRDKPDLLKALGAKNGVLVDTVEPGGPADKAGIKPEDIIIAMNGKPVKDGEDLVARVSETPVGSDVTVTVDRNGSKKDFKLTIADRAEVFKNDARFREDREWEEPSRQEGTEAKFGIYLRPLTDADRRDMKLEEKRGVLVTRVEGGSFAEEIGLQERDVILSINRQPVSNIDEVKRLQAGLKPGDAVAFRVMRPVPALSRGGRSTELQWQSFFLSGTLPANQ